MMEPYEIFLRAEATESLRGIRGTARKAVAGLIDSLALDPSATGDYAIQDVTGRVICIKVLGSHAVTFWADHATKEIKIKDIRSADRA